MRKLSREQIKPDSIPQHKHGHPQMMNKRRDYERQSSSMPSSNGSRNPEVHFIFICVCATCSKVGLLADSLVCHVPDVGTLQLGCVFVLDRWCYLQIASRASRVRLMSRICAARVWMGCMERSNSSQRAISVYMPCGNQNVRQAVKKLQPNHTWVKWREHDKTKSQEKSCPLCKVL